MRRATITGAGMHVPGEPIPNSAFDQRYKRDMSTFLVEQRNMHFRHHMAADQSTTDLILPAARSALAQSQVSAEDIDLVIVATDTPDQMSPATAVAVQHRLGAKRAGAFDVNAACAGFVTALDIGSRYIQSSERTRNILVCGAYGMSKHLDWDDFKLASLFADGAGAVVLQPSEDDCGILDCQLFADGRYYDAMGIYAGGTRQPSDEAALKNRDHKLKFREKIPASFNVEHWPALARSLLDRCGKQAADVDLWAMTQLNIGAIRSTLAELSISEDKAHYVMDRYGYTGSACIPMVLADAAEQGRLKKNDLICLLASGGGVAMGALCLKWSFDT